MTVETEGVSGRGYTKPDEPGVPFDVSTILFGVDMTEQGRVLMDAMMEMKKSGEPQDFSAASDEATQRSVKRRS
jgi:hypothetical protein